MLVTVFSRWIALLDFAADPVDLCGTTRRCAEAASIR
jgi:hypothetical protein